MKKCIRAGLAAVVSAVVLVAGTALAQGGEARGRVEVSDMPAVIQQVDPALREVLIDGSRFKMPAGVAVRFPFGEVRYGPDGLAPGMHVQMTGVLPASVQDVGEIRSLTVIAQ